MGVIHTGPKSECELLTLLFCSWYDKLWGPSLQVVTLFEVFHSTRNVNCKTLICNKGSICFILNDVALKFKGIQNWNVRLVSCLHGHSEWPNNTYMTRLHSFLANAPLVFVVFVRSSVSPPPSLHFVKVRVRPEWEEVGAALVNSENFWSQRFSTPCGSQPSSEITLESTVHVSQSIRCVSHFHFCQIQSISVAWRIINVTFGRCPLQLSYCNLIILKQIYAPTWNQMLSFVRCFFRLPCNPEKKSHLSVPANYLTVYCAFNMHKQALMSSARCQSKRKWFQTAKTFHAL